MSAFSERLSELRIEKRMGTIALGEAIGFSQATISRWENGLVEPGARAISAIAQFFSVTTDYLLGLDENLYTKPQKATLPKYAEIEAILDQLSKEDKDFVLDTAKLMLSRTQHAQGVRR